jgi:hypothetical protein
LGSYHAALAHSSVVGIQYLAPARWVAASLYEPSGFWVNVEVS